PARKRGPRSVEREEQYGYPRMSRKPCANLPCGFFTFKLLGPRFRGDDNSFGIVPGQFPAAPVVANVRVRNPLACRAFSYRRDAGFRSTMLHRGFNDNARERMLGYRQ